MRTPSEEGRLRYWGAYPVGPRIVVFADNSVHIVEFKPFKTDPTLEEFLASRVEEK